jgi:hypothetical protein
MTKTEISVVTVLSNVAMSDLRHCLKSTQAPGVEHILVLSGLPGLSSFVAVKLLAMKYKATLKLNRRSLPSTEALNFARKPPSLYTAHRLPFAKLVEVNNSSLETIGFYL